MVVKIKPNEIEENKDVKSFYEKQEELINEIRESIKVNGLRNPLVINQENILMVTPPVPSVTQECNHRWHPRKLLLNFPLQMDLQ
jgi:hypothetical protein